MAEERPNPQPDCTPLPRGPQRPTAALPARGVPAAIAEPLLAGVAVDHAGRVMDATVTKECGHQGLEPSWSRTGFNLAECKIPPSYNICKFFIKHILKPRKSRLTLKSDSPGTGWRGPAGQVRVVGEAGYLHPRVNYRPYMAPGPKALSNEGASVQHPPAEGTMLPRTE